jgi:hypothetical protein
MSGHNPEKMSGEEIFDTSSEEKGKINEKNRIFKMYLEAYRAPRRGFRGIDMKDYPEFVLAEKDMDDLIEKGICTEADRKFMKKEAQRRLGFEKQREGQK